MTKRFDDGKGGALPGSELPAVEPPEAPVTAPPDMPARDVPDEAAPPSPPETPPAPTPGPGPAPEGEPPTSPGPRVLQRLFPGTARRRGPRRWRHKPSLPKRPDPLYPMKIKIAIDLGLLDKVRAIGWGGLTSAETGRVGGLMTRRLKGKKRALRLWPGRSSAPGAMAPRRTS